MTTFDPACSYAVFTRVAFWQFTACVFVLGAAVGIAIGLALVWV